MLYIFILGFLSSFGQNIALGAQDVFILRNAFLKNRIFLCCLICSVCDMIMILSSIFGIEKILLHNLFLIKIFKLIGVIFLLFFAIDSFKAFFRFKSYLEIKSKNKMSAKRIILTGIGISILNPAAWLDTVFIIGTISLKYTPFIKKLYFALGSVFSSFAWFFILGFVCKKLLKFFQKEKIWKILNFSVGAVMLFLALDLFWDILKNN